MGWEGGKPGGQVRSDLTQRLLTGIGVVLHEGGAVVEAQLQPVHQLRHRRGSHTSRPALGEQRQQLPGIPRLGGERLLQGQGTLHGELVLARRHGLLPLLAQLGEAAP